MDYVKKVGPAYAIHYQQFVRLDLNLYKKHKKHFTYQGTGDISIFFAEQKWITLKKSFVIQIIAL